MFQVLLGKDTRLPPSPIWRKCQPAILYLALGSQEGMYLAAQAVRVLDVLIQKPSVSARNHNH